MEVKQPKTFEEQLAIIKERGCKVENEEEALRILKNINYYRLSAYFISFRKPDGKYYEGTDFEMVYQIYVFDRKLRNLLFPIIEEIELLLRTRLSYYFSHQYGALGYLDENNFNPKHNREKFLTHVNTMVENNKNKPFVKHHQDTYEGHFPLWVLVELMSFGELSVFYKDMTTADRKTFANEVFDARDVNLHSWLLCITDLRNCCAHYSRLYNIVFSAQPKTPKKYPYELGKRIFDYILVAKFLYIDKTEWNNSFVPSLEKLIDDYSDFIDLDCLGFVDNWRELLLN